MSVLLIVGILAIVGAIGFFLWPAKSNPAAGQEKTELPIPVANDFRKPGFNKRICSYLIDLLFISLIWLGFSFALKVNFPWWLAIIYWLLRDSFNGQSIGKIVVGLQVVDEEGKVITPVEGIIRNIIMTIPFISLLEYFFMVRDEHGRRLGDQFVQTKVNDLRPNVRDGQFLFISLVLVAAVVMLFWKFLYPEVQKHTQNYLSEKHLIKSP